MVDRRREQFTTRALAAANGLSENAQVVVGSTLQLPTVSEAAVAAAGPQPATAAAAAPPAAAPPAMGAYTVRPGDTLRASPRAAVSPRADGGDERPRSRRVLIAGTVLKLPTGSPAPPQPPRRRRAGRPDANPSPTDRGGRRHVASVASRNGVAGDLAAAIAWQESGFNNAMVRRANARGVMQVMPGTWDVGPGQPRRRQLDPDSPTDNVGAGVLYLGHLLERDGRRPGDRGRATTRASARCSDRDAARDPAVRRQRDGPARPVLSAVEGVARCSGGQAQRAEPAVDAATEAQRRGRGVGPRGPHRACRFGRAAEAQYVDPREKSVTYTEPSWKYAAQELLPPLTK